jgi:hypothetical protein
VRKGRRALDVLAEERAEVLNNLIRRLREGMLSAEVDKACDSDGGACLQVDIILILEFGLSAHI